MKKKQVDIPVRGHKIATVKSNMAATDTYAGRGTIPQNVKIYFRSRECKKFQWGIIKDPYRNKNMSLFELNP